jgi:hypothetical protein
MDLSPSLTARPATPRDSAAVARFDATREEARRFALDSDHLDLTGHVFEWIRVRWNGRR